jgi:hypothetical protein
MSTIGGETPEPSPRWPVEETGPDPGNRRQGPGWLFLSERSAQRGLFIGCEQSNHLSFELPASV